MIIDAFKSSLTPETILERTTEYEIYRHFVGANFTPNQAFSSPLRKDSNPSFSISLNHNHYSHCDFADYRFRGNCFDFVKQKYNVDFNQALLIIDREMGLGIKNEGTTPVVYKEPKRTEKVYRTIQVIPKKFTLEELKYWGEYYQGLPELNAENIYSVGTLFLDKEKYSLGDSNMTFGYLYENKYWKIYRPLIKGRGKWISSVPLQCVDGLEKIRGCRKAIVGKSRKDKMVLQYFIPTCSVQNESMAAFSEDTVTWLKGEAESVYVAFDCDKPGVESSWQVTSAFGFRHVNVPYEYLNEGIKDFADLARKYGLWKIQDYLKQKELI